MTARTLAVLVCAAATLASTSSRAEDIGLVPSVAAPARDGGRWKSVDVLGVRLGMRPQEVMEILKHEYADGEGVKYAHDSLEARRGTASVSSAPFLQAMVAERDYGTPSSAGIS
jgi:hypothetical protein